MILLIIGIILILISGFIFYQTIQIKIQKKNQQQTYQALLKQNIYQLQQRQNKLNIELNQSKKNINQELQSFYKNRTEQLETDFERQKIIIQNFIDKEYEKAKEEVQNCQNTIKVAEQAAAKQQQQLEEEINKIKSSINAAIETRKRQQEEKDKVSFYKLNITEIEQDEINKLENFKINFRNPIIINKLIWSQYFQKQTTELCDRVLGKKPICGIYRITNLVTADCYIGQSVDVSQRWKDHIKCGLGIDASATNKLYNNMQKYKVWNFMFELLEECPKDLLNEKEAFWIQTFQSNIWGYNSQKGNKT